MQNTEALWDRCVLCLNPGRIVCKTCNDYYCSKECQQLDSRHHALICFPMPALIYHKKPYTKKKMTNINLSKRQTQNRINTSTIINYINLKDGDRVKLLHFTEINQCYMQLASKKDVANHKQILNLIKVHGRSAPMLKNPPKQYTYCLGQYNGDWYRMIVLSTGNLFVFGMAIDIVRFFRCNINQIRVASEEILAFPIYATRVQLADIPLDIPKNACNLFLKKCKYRTYIVEWNGIENGKPQVNLFNYLTKTSIQIELKSFLKSHEERKALQTKRHNIIQTLKESDLKQEEIIAKSPASKDNLEDSRKELFTNWIFNWNMWSYF